jgi:hypothetical protein
MTFRNDDLWAPRLELWRDVCSLGLYGAQILVAHQFDATRAILFGTRTSDPVDADGTRRRAVAADDFLRLNAAIVVESMRLVEAATATAQTMLAEAEGTLLKALAPDPADAAAPRLAGNERAVRNPGRGGVPDQRLAA